MGRMVKNTVSRTGSHAIGTPIGSSTTGPDAPVSGQLRYNTTNSKMEFYNNSSWRQIAKEGNVTIAMDSFTGNSSIADYSPMSYSYATGQEAQVLVFVGTVFQIPGVNYSFYGNSQIHFTSSPSTGSSINILHNFASTITA